MKQSKEIFRRKASIWLALSLILVTIALWWALDPLLVFAYVTRQPVGYDLDRIVKLEMASSVAIREIGEDRVVPTEDWYHDDEEQQILSRVQELPEVEVAYRATNNPLGFGVMGMNAWFYHDNDSVLGWKYGFMPNSRMFEVYGLHSLTPGVPTSELTHDCEWDESIILTRSLALAIFGTIDVAGRRVRSQKPDYSSDKMTWVDTWYRVRAVVEDVRCAPYDRDMNTVFICTSGASVCAPIVLRLREGCNAHRFISEREGELQRDLITEHRYIRSAVIARDAFDFSMKQTGLGRQMRHGSLIAAFFTINLAFGVFGTLLMYTRERREEAGVRRAFGATKWSVFCGFIREAWLLTTVSVTIGCIIYFQFAATRGLYEFTGHNPTIHYWFDSFGTHFLVVSVIVYLIILCAVLIATAIPAWRICRSEITVALKDE
ncbi:MAG: FtsX-like permease family protein [Bacteroidaceae bacterium]|nr:FtsX-like permease family protein [Bacteroidaceae bacterium]